MILKVGTGRIKILLEIVYWVKITIMAKSRRKQKQEAKDKAQEKKFMQITAIVTVILLILLYFVFMRSN